MLKNVNNSPHYTWGDNCDGWHLLDTSDLSVIQERMPPGTEEVLHYHKKAEQLFYILSGKATFYIEEEQIVAGQGDSIYIKPNTKHCIKNLTVDEDLSFLVISQPKSHGDRVVL